MTNFDVVMKLIGPVRPVGESNIDASRFVNLEELIHLTDRLMLDIEGIAELRGRQEYSIARAGARAFEYLHNLKERYDQSV